MKILQKNCLVCKKLFSKPYTESIKNWNNRHKYCSIECTNKAPRSKETRNKMRRKKIGKPSWNKDKKLSKAHKKALRKKHKKIEDTSKMKGRRPWNKIGDGITPINERIRRSPEYKKWRIMVYERDNYACVLCGKRGQQDLNADHIKPFAYYPELRFELSNGRTLCVPCHRKTETYGINQWTQLSNKIAKNTNAA